MDAFHRIRNSIMAYMPLRRTSSNLEASSSELPQRSTSSNLGENSSELPQRRTSSNLGASSSELPQLHTRRNLGASSSEVEDDCVLIIKDVEDLKHLVQQRNGGHQHSSTRPMFRVRPGLRDSKPEHYTPAQISLGLFDRFPSGSKRTIADKCRLEMASAFLEAIGMTEDDGWEKLCDLVVPNPQEMKDLYYDELDRNCLSLNKVQSVLTLDAVFLACYNRRWSDNTSYDTDFATRYPSFVNIMAPITPGIAVNIIQDFLQVENQFPLSLVHKVLLILFRTADGGDPRSLELANNRFCLTCCYMVSNGLRYLPGFDWDDDRDRIESTPFLQCDNVLDCVYRAIYHRLPHHAVEDESAFVTLPSVTELQQAGIKFRGRKGAFHDVRFEKGTFKATLYIPLIKILDLSPGFWRNLIAYEAGDQRRTTTDVVRFAKFMNDLMKDEKDVLELAKSKVIGVNKLGTNEAVLQFNATLIQFCYVPYTSFRWNLLEREVLAYYNHPIRKYYVELMKTYFGRPWITLSLLGVISVIILTSLQTLYIMLGYYKVT